MSLRDLKDQYGKSNSRAAYNARIRDAYVGGNELLDLLELVSSMAQRNSGHAASIAKTIEDRLQDIRDAMVADIQAEYEILASRSPRREED